MTRTELAARLAETSCERRQIIAVAGSPGSGKSTLSDWLVEELGRSKPGVAAVLAMDGFHFDDIVLNARGHRPRKGAPHTFDTGGLLSALQRLVERPESEVAVPVFDRSIEIARAGARIIGPDVRTIIVEGNYLLLDDPVWAPLRQFFDATAFVEVPEAVLRERLTARWLGYGLSGEALETKLEGNDFPNMRTVLAKSVAPDFVVI
ncbi:nucleoside/nucleotide kinase family protein [Jiella sp. KSK16Y-1]|uniref:Nucleoside/nucleotide kinase family protein n=1 Tax=Jiella mangrovi TaxID=2821407 RepID=A0ABS4BHH5_9HYPH|nr:nucleoside/nucleotide kinase family protein [Jiella mangrovi]